MKHLRAFHGDPAVQATILDRVEGHYRLDEIQQGFYWEGGKGCLVGCSIHGSDHSKFETEAGVPVPVAHIADSIFEGLRNGQAKDFVPGFWRAIPLGADLSLVGLRFGLWSLTDEKWGLRQYIVADGDEKLVAVTEKIIGFYRRTIAGEDVPALELEDFDLADRADLAYLADRAYLAYLAYLAYRADRADRADLADLADLADRAYRAYLADLADLAYRAYRAYPAEYWIACRDQLLHLLSTAPVPLDLTVVKPLDLRQGLTHAVQGLDGSPGQQQLVVQGSQAQGR